MARRHELVRVAIASGRTDFAEEFGEQELRGGSGGQDTDKSSFIG